MTDPESQARLGPAENDWAPWTAFAALVAALVLAAVGSLIVDIPALALGVKITSEHVPHGIELADTIVQDLAFVATVILFAHLGGRTVRSSQIGLSPSRLRLWRTIGAVIGAYLAFFVFSAIWAAILHVSTKEELLKALGANETSVLLAFSALLTTVIAPICEETLFRGYIFAALSKWRGWLPAAALTGALFGAVHAGSAPAADLVPLAALGFMLCWLYRVTGSLYPCIAAHSLNNSIAFGALEGWLWWQVILLLAGALAAIAAIGLLLSRAGLISGVSPEPHLGLRA
jgi:CAAX protease family protein